MTGIVVLGALVVIVCGIAWTRLAAARDERRSVDKYERALDVLGSVSKRSDATANVRALKPGEVARPHVHAPEQEQYSLFDPPYEADAQHPPRTKLNLPAIGNEHRGALPVFGEDELPREREISTAPTAANSSPAIVNHLEDNDLEGNDGEIAIDGDDVDLSGNDEPVPAFVFSDDDELSAGVQRASKKRPSSPRLRRPHSGMDRKYTRRRALTGAAAAVGIGALAVGTWQLAGNQSPHSPSSSHTGSHSKNTTSHQVSTAPSVGSALEPTSNSNGISTYTPSSNSFTITFSDSEACWVGVESTPSTSGPWLGMKTVEPGTSWQFQASGSVVVRIGAPKSLSITVNGVPVALPKGDNPYDIAFVPSATTSA